MVRPNMSPEDFDAIFAAHAARARSAAERDRRHDAELREAESAAALADSEARLAASKRSLGLVEARGEAAIAEREAHAAESQRKADIAAAERDAAVRQLDRSEAQLRRVERRLESVEREHAAAVARRGAQADARVSEQEARALAAEARVDELGREVEALRAERDAIETGARVARGEQLARIRELEQLVSSLRQTLRATRSDLDRAERSRAWRFGHGVMRTASRARLRPDRTEGALRSALRRIDESDAGRALEAGSPEAPSAPQPAAPPPDDARSALSADVDARRALATRIRDQLGAAPTLEDWPAVSIVVVNRNGRALLEGLVDGLRDHTDYPDAELVVIDNGSTDDSVAWLRACRAGMSVHVIENARNESFSTACGQGVAVAANPLVLLLNNDVVPFEDGWLRELVAAHRSGDHAITGAVLLADDGTVQHRRVELVGAGGHAVARNAGAGAQLWDADFGRELAAAAVSAACLLIDRAAYDQLGGLSERYRFGLEDVDLGLRVTESAMRVSATGRSVVIHRGSVTRRAEGNDAMRAQREANRRALAQRWGPVLRRRYRTARLDEDSRWTDGRGPHVAIAVTTLDLSAGWGDGYTAHELGDALEATGWRVTYIPTRGESAPLPDDLDFVVTLLDRFDARTVPHGIPVVAWIRNWADRWIEQPWFWRLDVLLASSERIGALIDERTGRASTLFPLATNPARFAVADPAASRKVDAVFTGHHWGEDRAIQPALTPERGQSIVVHGNGWKRVSKVKKVADGPVAYDELPAIYADARLVLDDTREPTLRYDAVNSRVFDALAAGALPITNCAAGVRALFDDDFPTWEQPEDLKRERVALLTDDARRVALAERYRDVVLREHTYAARARQLTQVLRRAEDLPSFCIKIGAPDREQAERWGDLHFARAVERELRRRGHRCLIQTLDEWEDDSGLTYDVVLHLKGRSRHFTKPGQLNVLWCISHPDELTAEECDSYDLVAIASEPFAEHMKPRTRTPVIVLEQATDPRVFYPDPHPDPAHHHDVVYVANSRNVLRPMMRDLLPTDLDLAVYGANWDGLIDTRYVVADHVPNDELRRIYSSAKVVLADHWEDMRRWGFVSNRIYDAVACGAAVVSDDVLGLEGRFAGAVATYREPSELGPAITRAAQSDPVEVSSTGFAARVDVLTHTIHCLRQARSVA